METKATFPDANLIAAAPDLLAACKTAKFLYAHGVGAAALNEHTKANADRNVEAARAIFAQIDAAIAKAEGSTP